VELDRIAGEKLVSDCICKYDMTIRSLVAHSVVSVFHMQLQDDGRVRKAAEAASKVAAFKISNTQISQVFQQQQNEQQNKRRMDRDEFEEHYLDEAHSAEMGTSSSSTSSSSYGSSNSFTEECAPSARKKSKV
jgi:hypothetical protein